MLGKQGNPKVDDEGRKGSGFTKELRYRLMMPGGVGNPKEEN